MRVLTLILLLALPAWCVAAQPGGAQGALPEVEVIYPDEAEVGQPFIVEFSTRGQLTDARVFWLGRELALGTRTYGGVTRAQAVLGTDVLRPPSEPPVLTVAVTVDGQTHKAARAVNMTTREYPLQELTVQPSKAVPPPETQQRIAAESKAVGKALRTITPGRAVSLPLVTPVDGRVSSVYGLRRTFNGHPRRPHRGLDIAAPTGTPIKAAATGIVILTGDHYFAGKSVYVDHGQGFITAYFHLSDIGVEEGVEVEAGEVIGKVGASGRVTGPHLHLGVYTLGQAVDPEPLLETSGSATK